VQETLLKQLVYFCSQIEIFCVPLSSFRDYRLLLSTFPFCNSAFQLSTFNSYCLSCGMPSRVLNCQFCFPIFIFCDHRFTFSFRLLTFTNLKFTQVVGFGIRLSVPNFQLLAVGIRSSNYQFGHSASAFTVVTIIFFSVDLSVSTLLLFFIALFVNSEFGWDCSRKRTVDC